MRGRRSRRAVRRLQPGSACLPTVMQDVVDPQFGRLIAYMFCISLFGEACTMQRSVHATPRRHCRAPTNPCLCAPLPPPASPASPALQASSCWSRCASR